MVDVVVVVVVVVAVAVAVAVAVGVAVVVAVVVSIKGISMTQTEQVLAHLKRGHTLTAMQAMRLLGICCLAERVRDARAKGHTIYAERIKLPSGRYCARYSLG